MTSSSDAALQGDVKFRRIANPLAVSSVAAIAQSLVDDFDIILVGCQYGDTNALMFVQLCGPRDPAVPSTGRYSSRMIAEFIGHPIGRRCRHRKTVTRIK